MKPHKTCSHPSTSPRVNSFHAISPGAVDFYLNFSHHGTAITNRAAGLHSNFCYNWRETHTCLKPTRLESPFRSGDLGFWMLWESILSAPSFQLYWPKAVCSSILYRYLTLHRGDLHVTRCTSGDTDEAQSLKKPSVSGFRTLFWTPVTADSVSLHQTVLRATREMARLL